MNPKITRLLVVSTILAMLALVTVTLGHAYTNRTYQHTTNHESTQESDHHESSEEIMEQWTHMNETYDEHHGTMHGETEEPSNSRHGCH